MTPISWTCALWGVLIATAVPASSTLPRVFLPAPEEPLSMTGRVCDNPTAFLALVLVMSHPDNIDKRRAMRLVYPDSEIAALGFRRAFVIGTNSGLPRANSTGVFDVLHGNSTDTYDGLVFKTLAAFSWAADRCSHARFIAKADDDMFIDYYTLATLLDAIDDDGVHAIRGHLNKDNVNLTPYMAGGFYVSSPKTFRAVVRVAVTTEMFMHLAEDVYFTGVLADKVGANRVDMAAVRHWEGAPHCCLDDARGVVYSCQYAVFEDRRGMADAHALRFKSQGRFCYFFKCENFTGTLLGETGLTCFR